MASTYEPIATYTVSGSSTNSITFSSIPSTYTDLVLIFSGRLSSSLENMLITINSDTGSNYSNTYMQRTTTTSSGRNTNQTIWYSGAINTEECVSTYYFFNYANTTTYKTAIHRMSNTNLVVSTECALWRSTSAISTIKISNSATYTSGATATLYGIKAA